MEKKVYIEPVTAIYQLNIASGILISGSANGETLFESNSGTTSSGYSGTQDTKDEGDFDLWDE